MFWKHRKDIIECWYQKLDALVGRINETLKQKSWDKNPHLLVVSDHGFGDFDYKVHLNRWLANHGYLTPSQQSASGNLKHVDWINSRAYALGLNSLYLNVKGREAQGILPLDEKADVVQDLQKELLHWVGPDGRTVVQSVLTQEEAFQGSLSEYGPDLVIGYRQGYRASAETGLGQWEEAEIETNCDQWQADHCFDAEAVPGVIFSNRNLKDIPKPSYSDFPVLVLGKEVRQDESVLPPIISDEDQETIEKRLKELGYL